MITQFTLQFPSLRGKRYVAHCHHASRHVRAEAIKGEVYSSRTEKPLLVKLFL